jgi:hypothetical protein
MSIEEICECGLKRSYYDAINLISSPVDSIYSAPTTKEGEKQ